MADVMKELRTTNDLLRRLLERLEVFQTLATVK
jgi:hypothetical protein